MCLEMIQCQNSWFYTCGGLVTPPSLYIINPRLLDFKRKLISQKQLPCEFSRSVDTIPDLSINIIKGVIKDYLTKKIDFMQILIKRQRWQIYVLHISIIYIKSNNLSNDLNVAKKFKRKILLQGLKSSYIRN